MGERRKYLSSQKAHKKILNTTSHQENKNESSNEILLYIQHDG